MANKWATWDDEVPAIQSGEVDGGDAILFPPVLSDKTDSDIANAERVQTFAQAWRLILEQRGVSEGGLTMLKMMDMVVPFTKLSTTTT